MVKSNSIKKLLLVFLGVSIGLGMIVLPYPANAKMIRSKGTVQDNPVDVAKAAIDNYFRVLLSAQDVSAAQQEMITAMAAVTNPSDQIIVTAYYDQVALVSAKTATDDLFATLLAAQDPAKNQFILQNVMAAVLNPADKTTAAHYYDQVALTSSKTATDNYFATLLAAQDPAKNQFILQNVMAAVLNPADKTTAAHYYDQVALTSSKTATDNYFVTLLAAQDPAKNQFILQNVMAAVLNPADKTTAAHYYDQVALTSSKTATDNYFVTLLAAQDPAKDKFILQTVMGVILNPADKTLAANYYDQIALKDSKNTINQYFQYVWALQDHLQAQFIMTAVLGAVLNPTDKVTTAAYYDSLNGLVSGHLSTLQLNSGFAQSVAVVQSTGELFVGAPSLENTGGVYYYKGFPSDLTNTIPTPNVISAKGLTAGSQFGKTLAANQNTLVVQGGSKLYFYSHMSRRIWAQISEPLDLSQIENLDPNLFQNLKLSLSDNQLAVAAPSVRVVYIISRVNGFWNYSATLRLSASDAAQVQFAQSVAVGNGIIAVGAPRAGSADKSKIFIYRYKGQGVWILEQTYENILASFGKEIGVLKPDNFPANLTAVPVIGHQIVTTVTTEDGDLASHVLVFQEELSAPYGSPLSMWDTGPITLDLPWHSGSLIRALVAQGNSLAVAAYSKITPADTSDLSASDSVVVFKRQADDSVQWTYNLAAGTTPNFGTNVAVDHDTVVATYPGNDNSRVIKSGIQILTPKVNLQ